jgi:hypothetical protein
VILDTDDLGLGRTRNGRAGVDVEEGVVVLTAAMGEGRRVVAAREEAVGLDRLPLLLRPFDQGERIVARNGGSVSGHQAPPPGPSKTGV